MLELNFTIKGDPQGKGRPKFFKGHAVTPKQTRTYESLIRYEASHAVDHMVEQPDFTAPCAVRIKAYYAIPDSYSKKKRALIAQKGTMGIRPGKPDIDNVIKSVLDGMNGIVFRDDVQVVRLSAEKFWCEGNDVPHVDVRVRWGEED